MAQIICPKCGCENTTALSELKALNDAPAKEINKQEDLKKDTSLLTKVPSYHCRNCEKDFGGDTAHFEKSTTRIYVNTYKKGTVSQTLTFYKTPAGATVSGPFLCYYPELPEIYLNHEEWDQLLKAFYGLYVTDWKTDYKHPDCSYEFGWDLKIKFEDQEPFMSQGEDQYPPYWDALMDLFVSFGLPNIKNKLGQNFL